MKKLMIFLCMLLFCGYAFDSVSCAENSDRNDFVLFNENMISGLIYDNEDYQLISTTASLFAGDMAKVSSRHPKILCSSKEVSGNVVVIGSLQRSKLIKELVSRNLVDTLGMTSAWERYSYQVIENPWRKGYKALVIMGSDRRGTAYGVLELSHRMGVSPWYWWADVPVKRRNSMVVDGTVYKSKEPSVRYRGIFINDEDWGMLPWSKENFEKELGDIGPKTYEKVCELLLRLKANCLWPAMHECTGAFFTHKQNKVVADKYGIVIGASHCEPLLFNNATEWNTKTMGKWDYAVNRHGICKALDKRVSEIAQYENIYPIGLRGIHDHAMEGGHSVEKQIALLEKAIADQREILKKHTGKSPEQIPQIFIPYAEVLHLYNNGLKLPDDITIMWVDDNYGYVRRLSNSLEQQRKGGSGLYYHLAYLGNPHSYTWLSTMNPALIYQELKKSYDYGADRIWIANVGDLKPVEYNIDLFMDLAWDIHSLNYEDVFSHLEDWYVDCFGEKTGKECAGLMYDYYQINFVRKPEFMGWGQEYGYFKWRERVQDTEFSLVNYREAEERINYLEEMNRTADRLRSSIGKDYLPSFIELVGYPVKGNYFMNKKLLLAQKNRFYAKIGHAGTNELINEVKLCHDSIRIINEEYENMLNGKWKEMISEVQSASANFSRMPPLEEINIPDKPSLGLLVEENPVVNGTNQAFCLPVFSSFYKEKNYYVDIFNKGKGTLKWQAVPKADWIILSKTSGTVLSYDRIYVSVDWDKVKNSEETAFIEISSRDMKYMIQVKYFNPKMNSDSVKGIYVENNGYISIPLEKYHRKIESDDVKWIVKPGLGITGASLGIENNLAKSIGHWVHDNTYPHVEYDFYTFNSGRFDIYAYVLPTYPITSFMQQRFAVVVDDGERAFIYAGAEIDSDRWRNNVRRNSSVHVSSHYIEKPGKHTLKIFFCEPGVVLDKVVIDFGGMKKSYLGPETTLY